MPKPKQRDSATTKQAIIDAAGFLFADRGFAGVTARAVAAQANVALSAIPYHFGSMEALYREALLEACRQAPDAEQLAQDAIAAKPAAGLLAAARWAVVDASIAASSWGIRLLMREEFDPSPAFKEILDLKFFPEWEWLCQVVARATDRDADSNAVKFGTIVLYTTALSFVTRSSVLDKLAPDVVKAFGDRQDALAQCVASLTIDAVERYEAALGGPEATEGVKASAKKKRPTRGGGR
jgi:TetR/AcrR family transcriptional regulator, regulator of cefoperazone and chloramphenicol sensitivity